MSEIKATDTQEIVVSELLPPLELTLWMSALLVMAISTMIAGLLIAGYHHFVAKRDAGFVVVDIASIVKAREVQFTELLSRPGVGDQERMQAYQLVSRMGPEIEKAIQELQKECACTIMVKSAVIAGPTRDLTGRLREMLGIGSGE